MSSFAEGDVAPVAALNHGEIEAAEFSWLDPHPVFVIILVGPNEKPFGIQKNFLCAKCRYFREYFAKEPEEAIEYIVRLPDTSAQVFSHAQNFLYTGNVSASADQIPSYDVLVEIWKFGYGLGVDGLCERTLEAMTEYRRISRSIPDTPLLVKVWKDTPEGSSIRQLLLSWAVQYLRSSQERSGFARSLPQELLSELVVAMSSYDESLLTGSVFAAAAAVPGSSTNPHFLDGGSDSIDSAVAAAANDGVIAVGSRPHSPLAKRPRYLDFYTSTPASAPNVPVNGNGSASSGKKTGRTALPGQRAAPKKRASAVDVGAFSTEQKLKFCSDLLTRMLSGPGFWTRLVGPFREPVDPVAEGIPNYLDKVKRPMDLSTIKANLDNGRYRSEDEFLADTRQIFANVYMYWNKGDRIWDVCERLEKTFEEKYAQMNKWLGKMDGEEIF